MTNGTYLVPCKTFWFPPLLFGAITHSWVSCKPHVYSHLKKVSFYHECSNLSTLGLQVFYEGDLINNGVCWPDYQYAACIPVASLHDLCCIVMHFLAISWLHLFAFCQWDEDIVQLLDCESVTTTVSILGQQSPAVGDCELLSIANIHHILDIFLPTS